MSAKDVASLVVGVVLLAGSIFAWRFWNLPPVPSVFLGAFGLVCIAAAVETVT